MSTKTLLSVLCLTSAIACYGAVAHAEESTIKQINTDGTQSVSVTTNPATAETTVTQTNLTTGESTSTLYTPVPEPKEVIPIPVGYSNCFSVEAGWKGEIWIPKHRVCQYDTSKGAYQGSTWIDGYWKCTEAKRLEGMCIKWEWQPGRWVTSLEVY